MKLWILFLSIAAMTVAYWWLTGGSRHRRPIPFSLKLRLAGRSLAIGIVVYFCLLLLAIGYLAIRAG